MQKVFLITLVLFALGVGVGTVLKVPPEFSLWLLFISLVLGLLRLGDGSNDYSSKFLVCSIGIFAVALGLVRTEIHSWQFGHSSLESVVGEEVLLEGLISGEPDYGNKSVTLEIETLDDTVLVSTDAFAEYSYGDYVRVTGEIEKPGVFVTDLGREFDYKSFLLGKGIEYRISFAEVEVLEVGKGSWFVSSLLDTKSRFVTAIESIIPEPQVALGEGVLLGIKSALGDDIEEDFRRTGIIHIVVLSGYNVMLVVSFVSLCLSRMAPLPRMMLGIVSIISFALLVGLSATVVRASIMGLLVMVAQTFRKRYDVFVALFVAGFVMLFVNPYILMYDIGFQLSFMATLGLIMIVPYFEQALVDHSRVFGLRDFFLATVATQIAVLPLLLYHIGEISLVSVIVNVLVLPMVGVAMFLTFVTGIFSAVSVTLAMAAGALATLSLGYILEVARVFGSLPLAAVSVPEFGLLVLVIMYGLLGYGYWYIKVGKYKEKSIIDGWEIVEEESLEKKTADSQGESAEKDVPVFFR